VQASEIDQKAVEIICQDHHHLMHLVKIKLLAVLSQNQDGIQLTT